MSMIRPDFRAAVASNGHDVQVQTMAPNLALMDAAQPVRVPSALEPVSFKDIQQAQCTEMSDFGSWGALRDTLKRQAALSARST